MGTRVTSLSCGVYVSHLSNCRDGVGLENRSWSRSSRSCSFSSYDPPAGAGPWDAVPQRGTGESGFRMWLTSPRSALNNRLQARAVRYLTGRHWAVRPRAPAAPLHPGPKGPSVPESLRGWVVGSALEVVPGGNPRRCFLDIHLFVFLSSVSR